MITCTSQTCTITLSECRCLYRSTNGTYTSENTPEMPVPVPLMDLYEHSSLDGEGFASTDRETEGGGGEAGGVHEVGAGVGLPGVADGYRTLDR